MKKLKKLSSLLVLTIIISLFVVSCGGNRDNVKIATGGSSGTYYPLGHSMARLFDENGISASALETKASVENMRLLKRGEVELAFTQSDIVDYAFKGIEMFKEIGPMENVQAIASLHDETIQVIVLADGPIHTIADLKGKTVSTGEPGSGTEVNARQILETVDMSMEQLERVEQLSVEETMKALRDGKIDAAFITGVTDGIELRKWANGKRLRVINLDDEHIARLIEKYPYYTEKIASKSDYDGMDGGFKTVAVKTQLVTRAELDEGLVYNLTKTLFEHLEEFTEENRPIAEGMTVERALEGISIDLHPGAAKYFEEIGVK